MLTHPTHDALRALKLDGMAEVLAELLAREDSRQMDPIEWIGLMLDRESATRDTRRFQTRLRAAKLRDSTGRVLKTWIIHSLETGPSAVPKPAR